MRCKCVNIVVDTWKSVLTRLGSDGDLMNFYIVWLDMPVAQGGNSVWRRVWLIMYYIFSLFLSIRGCCNLIKSVCL